MNNIKARSSSTQILIIVRQKIVDIRQQNQKLLAESNVYIQQHDIELVFKFCVSPEDAMTNNARNYGI